MKATRGLLVTICNYSHYQDINNYGSNDDSNNEKATKATREQRQPNRTNNNDKNDKNDRLKEKDKKEKSLFENYAKDDAELLKALYDFAEMRKAIKKPLPTEHAKELLLSTLAKLTSDSKTKIAILEQSILNNWQGVFELKEGYRGSNKKSNQKPDDKWGDLPGVRNF